ncbi:hypothetical protein GOV11_00315 [Candidatus Woesearchaeota archaeon]|nr:hypothetical protein [Candidatus Woesearchaeota archaeon]
MGCVPKMLNGITFQVYGSELHPPNGGDKSLEWYLEKSISFPMDNPEIPRTHDEVLDALVTRLMIHKQTGRYSDVWMKATFPPDGGVELDAVAFTPNGVAHYYEVKSLYGYNQGILEKPEYIHLYPDEARDKIKETALNQARRVNEMFPEVEWKYIFVSPHEICRLRI